ncbi:MAG: hypothetical protein K6E35_07850 [Bacteroidales bacterium]|nr:hypothetical protein [Bacteroidales bacterium]
MKGIELVAAERQRQIDQEGYSIEHDLQHPIDTLLYAALCYLDPKKAYIKKRDDGPFHGVPTVDLQDGPEGPGTYYVMPRLYWPFELSAWKPCPNNRVREIVKGLALGVAYLDQRLRRKGEDTK